jgi:hypothetical protein
MNNIQEDDWADDTWSRHSGMTPNSYSLDDKESGDYDKSSDNSTLEDNCNTGE